MDAEQLIDKRLRVERLFAGPATDGEPEAAANAAERIRARLNKQSIHEVRLASSLRWYKPYDRLDRF